MSTCTPTVYNGRAYVGVSGTSQFGAYSGHNITVIDLESMSIAYTVRTKGYPQTSGVLTTAYAGDDDTVYVYFFDNFTPGMLRVIADRPARPNLPPSCRRNIKAQHTIVLPFCSLPTVRRLNMQFAVRLSMPTEPFISKTIPLT